jgi:hypothetical protein
LPKALVRAHGERHVVVWLACAAEVPADAAGKWLSFARTLRPYATLRTIFVRKLCPHAKFARSHWHAKLCPQAPRHQKNIPRKINPQDMTKKKYHVKDFSYPFVPIVKWICHPSFSSSS